MIASLLITECGKLPSVERYVERGGAVTEAVFVGYPASFGYLGLSVGPKLRRVRAARRLGFGSLLRVGPRAIESGDEFVGLSRQLGIAGSQLLHVGLDDPDCLADLLARRASSAFDRCANTLAPHINCRLGCCFLGAVLSLVDGSATGQRSYEHHGKDSSHWARYPCPHSRRGCGIDLANGADPNDDVRVRNDSGPVTIEVVSLASPYAPELGEIRWREWGHEPEPDDLSWWIEMACLEVGDGGSNLPVTFVAVFDNQTAVGGVGLEEFESDERRNVSPWVVGTVISPDRRHEGIGRALMSRLEQWAIEHEIGQAWVATGSGAEHFYENCGWREIERVPSREGDVVVILTKDFH